MSERPLSNFGASASEICHRPQRVVGGSSVEAIKELIRGLPPRSLQSLIIPIVSLWLGPRLTSPN